MVKLIVPIMLIGLCIISDLYIFHRYITTQSVWRWIWWIPLLIVFGFFAKFLFFNSGLEKEYTTTNIFLLVMGLVCIPKILFAICSGITLLCKVPQPFSKIGDGIGVALGIGVIYILLYGITIGFSQIKVTRIVFESPNVPKSFDGYKIVQFSDAHVGSFRGPYAHLLKESCDTINSLHPDLICFVGDIENFGPSELEQHKAAFSTLKAKDGIFTIMGNHDYSSYVKVTPAKRRAMIQGTRNLEKSFGWDMLDNTHRIIHRGADSIYIVGEENWGFPPFQQYGNVKKAIAGLDPNTLSYISESSAHSSGSTSSSPQTTLTIMLSHDPNAWENHILPVFRPDITLSGHTHGTQFSLFGWSPSSMAYKEWGNTYYRNSDVSAKDGAFTISRKNSSIIPTLLNVSTGFGGNFPFRFHMAREVVLITLKHGNDTKRSETIIKKGSNIDPINL